MVSEVEIGAGMYALKFLESEREVEFYVRCGVGIVSQFLVVVEAVIALSHPESLVPGQTLLFPFCEPIQFGTRLDEELHLHLFEFPHTEDELTGHNLVPESLSDLGNSERNLHTSGLLHIEIVHEYALSSLRTEIYDICVIGSVSELGGEHKVELTHISPVFGAGNRADNFAVNDNLTQFSKVVCIQSISHPLAHSLDFSGVSKHIRIGLAEFLLIESLSEFLARLLHLLVVLFLKFGDIILNEHVCPVTFLGILIVYERVVESSHVS